MLARENLMVYWDEQNGYNDTMQENQGSGEAPATAGGEFEGGTSYVAMMEGIGGQEAHLLAIGFDAIKNYPKPVVRIHKDKVVAGKAS